MRSRPRLNINAAGRRLHLLGITATVLSVIVFLGPASGFSHSWTKTVKQSPQGRTDVETVVSVSHDGFWLFERDHSYITLLDGNQMPFRYRARYRWDRELLVVEFRWLKFLLVGLIFCWPVGIYLRSRGTRRGFEILAAGSSDYFAKR